MTNQKETITFDPDEIPCQEISDPAVLAKTPLVSVGMITYNHEPYIAQAIEGVLHQQTDFPIELVIGEDCSTDRTREIVFDYQQKHPDLIRVITSDKNVGLKKNAWRTARARRGKYIAFCEGDDYWHHVKKLQIQVDYLESHPEVGLVHSDVVWNDVKTGKTIPRHYKERKLSHDHENVLRSIIEFKYHVMTCSAVVRKEMYDEIRRSCVYEFSEKFLMGDIQTWAEIAYRSKVKYMNEPLATYHELPESACRSQDIEKTIRFRRNFQQIQLHYANKYGGEDSLEMKKEIVGRSNEGLMHLACHACNARLAREILENSRKYESPLGLIGYFCYIGSRNIVASHIVRFGILPFRLCRRALRVIKTMNNR